MDVLPCGHAANAAEARGCAHLVVERPPDHYGWFTGVGLAYDLLCGECSKDDDPRSHLIVVCVGCADRVDDYSDLLGWFGQPEIRHRDTEPHGMWTTADCAVEPVNGRCVAALPGGWLVLTEAGLVEIDQAGSRFVAPVSLAVEPPDRLPADPPRPALHTSPDGRYAAVVTDFGRYGVVLDLVTGAPVRSLDRGDYRYRHASYPVAFLESGAGTVVVTATDWNRLDAFDLASGRLLTERETSWSGDGPKPEHYLDYFHGALLTGPSGRWLLDDGWVWSPSGMPVVHDVAAWLGGDVYATEHGRGLSVRDSWDHPMAWVDEHIAAIQPIGRYDQPAVAGVEVYDVVDGRRVGAFAGPAGRMWGHDGLLYVVTVTGLEIWDPEDGARTGVVAGFTPIAHNPRTGRFAELTGGRLRTWTPAS
ncbi:hypothetical protein ALI22I_17010 [Saccharothrix sp. ALI-22-I]|uniref:YncE family protein n=1 Tax=Saccharothrix sp. ALI-22-I TaxID=1933778 RepID=UPI0009D2DEEB|nr:hypothetical protein [Saccharothrix sp. ALI-22-I]ONI89200.1 hypothetical protein ALI22I_17010 [Saccharothrix sp. ALI-22-I]